MLTLHTRWCYCNVGQMCGPLAEEVLGTLAGLGGQYESCTRVVNSQIYHMVSRSGFLRLG